jgi:hypothetical protein
MTSLFEKFEKVGVQARAWKFYGILTPIFFGLVFFEFHLMTNQIPNIVLLGWVLFIITCLIWWFWTIRIFQTIIESQKTIHVMVVTVAKDISDVKEDVKQISKPKTKNSRQSK